MQRDPLTFNRSNQGIFQKYEEAVKVIEYSLIFVEFFDIKEFNNILAGQLRLIICDTSIKRGELVDNSLIKKVNNNPMLYQVGTFTAVNEKTEVILGDLFDYSKPKIPLKEWLNQVILKINLDGIHHKITIFDFIKESANKGGGAHVDTKLPEDSFIVDVYYEREITRIAKGFLRSVGRDFDKYSKQHLSNLISKFKEKASN